MLNNKGGPASKRPQTRQGMQKVPLQVANVTAMSLGDDLQLTVRSQESERPGAQASDLKYSSFFSLVSFSFSNTHISLQ